MSDRVKRLEPGNERLHSVEKDYNRIRQFLGGERTDKIISEVKTRKEVRAHEIGRFGRVHLRYLKEHKRLLYTELLTSGSLYEPHRDNTKFS